MGGFTYFDLLAHFGIGGAHPGGILLTKELLSKEKISSDSQILDAGCGTGQTSAFLFSQYEANICGLDLNPIMLEKAEKRFKAEQMPIKLIKGSIEEIPLETDSFDFVLSESVLAFVQKKKALSEFNRVLKKGGRLIANEMTINHPLSPEEENEIKQFYGLDTLLLEDDWIKLLKGAGFVDIEINNENKTLLGGNSVPEFHFSENFEPALFDVLHKHAEIILKYQDSLSYRTITATKE